LTELLDVSEARQKLLEVFEPVGGQRVPLAQSAGRVLAANIHSDYDLPPFANSSMDGFAVRVDDLHTASREKPVTLPVVADIPAGEVTDLELQPGQSVRIMTGAPVPAGAEAVIPVEDTDFNARQPGLPAPARVSVYRPVVSGENIRPRGMDIHTGEIVLPAHQRLRPQDVGLLAMLGVKEVPVFKRPRVALFSTGDELLPVEEPLRGGKIHDSNAYILSAQIERYGAEAVYMGIAKDLEDAVSDVLEKAAREEVDLILSSAGVSVGAFDFVRKVVEENGRLGFWRVNMRPGKPLAFGHYRNIPFVGLPGNPVSAFVGFEVFVRPALVKLSGALDWVRPAQRVTLSQAIESDGRESYLRAVVVFNEGKWVARLTGHQGSGNLRSLVQANALLIIGSGVKSLPSGAEVDAWILDGSTAGLAPDQA